MVLKVKCTHCGTWNELEDSYCKDCGYGIESTSESKVRNYNNKILNRQALFILILFFMIDIVGIIFETSVYGTTFKFFMNAYGVENTQSPYFKDALGPLVIITVIQAVIFELLFYLQFSRRTQFREYYQFYLSIPVIHWLLLFFVALLLALINTQFFSATIILLLTGSSIGLVHLLYRGGAINKDRRNTK